MDQFYEKPGSLFVEAYDAFYSDSGPQIANVVNFYESVARKVGGPDLELACGGRAALPCPSRKRDCTLQASTDPKRC